MTIMHHAALIISLLGVAEAGHVHAQVNATDSSADKAVTDTNPVAKVNGVIIPQSSFDELLRQAVAKGQADTQVLRVQIREQLIDRELLYQEALRRRLDQTAEYKAAVQSVERQLLEASLLRTLDASTVKEADVRLAYDKSMGHLAPNDVNLSAIVVANEATIRQIWSKLAQGADFEKLARTNSILPSKRSGGNMGWVNLRTDQSENLLVAIPSAVAAAARKLPKGGMTEPVVDGSRRWWIVRITDTRATRPLSYKQASPRLRAAMQGATKFQKKRELLESLRKTAIIN